MSLGAIAVIGTSAYTSVGNGPLDKQGRLIRLRDFATQPEFVYSNKLEGGDLVMWDNTGSLHRLTPFDPAFPSSLLHRTSSEGEGEGGERSPEVPCLTQLRAGLYIVFNYGLATSRLGEFVIAGHGRFVSLGSHRCRAKIGSAIPYRQGNAALRRARQGVCP
jgi:hypothetical protein